MVHVQCTHAQTDQWVYYMDGTARATSTCVCVCVCVHRCHVDLPYMYNIHIQQHVARDMHTIERGTHECETSVKLVTFSACIEVSSTIPCSFKYFIQR